MKITAKILLTLSFILFSTNAAIAQTINNGNATGNATAGSANVTGGTIGNTTGGNASGGNVTSGNATTTAGSANVTGANVTSGNATTTTGSANTTGGNVTANTTAGSANVTGGGNANSNSTNSSNGNSTNVDVSNNAPASPVSTAAAPALIAAEDTCMGSSSAGAQSMGFGLSLGSTWQDTDCVRRKDARELHNMGHKNAAIALMCQNDKVRKAMEDAGEKCPGLDNVLVNADDVQVPKSYHVDKKHSQVNQFMGNVNSYSEYPESK